MCECIMSENRMHDMYCENRMCGARALQCKHEKRRGFLSMSHTVRTGCAVRVHCGVSMKRGVA